MTDNNTTSAPYKPEIFTDPKQLPHDAKIVEAYDSALRELFFVTNPQFKKNMPEAAQPLADFLASAKGKVGEVWVFYPERSLAVHTVAENDYFKLRTARNKLVITEAEQAAYRKLSVGVAGLSVGSAVVAAFAISGGPKRMKIADFDTVEVSNLNRIQAGLVDLGENKVTVSARKVWQLDPFAELELWRNGVSRENIEQFLLQPKLDLFVDEMDSLDLKIIARQICRKHKIPVLMATDNGDSVILDIERFDQEPGRKLFHGLIEEMDPEQLKSLDYKSWLRLATQIVGPEYLTERMQQSVASIGREIAGVPQLGTTAAIAGTAISFAARRIANGQEMPSGRYTVGCEEKLEPGYNSAEAVERRRSNAEKFKKLFSNNSQH